MLTKEGKICKRDNIFQVHITGESRQAFTHTSLPPGHFFLDFLSWYNKINHLHPKTIVVTTMMPIFTKLKTAKAHSI